jgi:hypothetical protein
LDSTCNDGSWDSPVGIVTGYGQDGRGLIPGRVKISLLSASSRLTLGPTHSPLRWVPETLSLGVKWPGCEINHSPPSSVEVKNGGAMPFTLASIV